MDPRRQDLSGSVFRLEQGSAEGKGEVRERRDLAERICAVVKAVTPILEGAHTDLISARAPFCLMLSGYQ